MSSMQLMPVPPPGSNGSAVAAGPPSPGDDSPLPEETELDVFRGELLRQKIVFSSELRRQREVAAKQTAALQAQLAARDDEAARMHRMLSALAARVELLEANRPLTPRSAAQAPPAPGERTLALLPRPYRSATPPSRPGLPTPLHDGRASRRLASPRQIACGGAPPSPPPPPPGTPAAQTLLSRTPSNTPRHNGERGDPRAIEDRPRSPRPTLQRPTPSAAGGAIVARNSATFSRTLSAASASISDAAAKQSGSPIGPQWK